MYVKDSDIRERLLESGRQEFLQYGFKQASLRRICSNASVTTGAIYSCFESKEDLFGSIVGGTVDELKQMMQESCRRECQDSTVTIDDDVEMMEFFKDFFRQYAGTEIDDELVHIIVRTRIRGLIEILKGGYSLERSLELAKNMSIYSNTGYQKLIELAERN